jgi:DNA-binding protein YbaB
LSIIENLDILGRREYIEKLQKYLDELMIHARDSPVIKSNTLKTTIGIPQNVIDNPEELQNYYMHAINDLDESIKSLTPIIIETYGNNKTPEEIDEAFKQVDEAFKQVDEAFKQIEKNIENENVTLSESDIVNVIDDPRHYHREIIDEGINNEYVKKAYNLFYPQLKRYNLQQLKTIVKDTAQLIKDNKIEDILNEYNDYYNEIGEEKWDTFINRKKYELLLAIIRNKIFYLQEEYRKLPQNLINEIYYFYLYYEYYLKEELTKK